MTKAIAITILSVVVLLAGAAVVLAQTTQGTTPDYGGMPMWGGETTGSGITEGVTDISEVCGNQTQEHRQNMEQHMQDGTMEQHMQDGTMEQHHGADGTGHMSDQTREDMQQTMNEHMGDGTYQDHMGSGAPETGQGYGPGPGGHMGR
ncbi:hypothetical protein BMS3Abin01_00749 [bacterium BMS3Abin01]|nr:hypothetical protein BMS3Abin01_00749 [bacterium BMS3Abin01]HDZ59591.1 hypothetical protein [Actinomycetota bacterium]